MHVAMQACMVCMLAYVHAAVVCANPIVINFIHIICDDVT